MNGFIHSIETCGTVDGPGVRFVVFMQGCPLRCKYCHNPDTQETGSGRKISTDEILAQYKSVREFAKGGITLSGGEPLMQLEFAIELFKKAKQLKIHTALDTSGAVFSRGKISKFNELIKYTDLVLLDIKHIDNIEHKKLTNAGNENILDFARYLSENNVPVLIRHVLVRGLTDKKSDLENLGAFMAELKNVHSFEVLPYHNMAIPKYEALKRDYPLKNIAPATENEVKTAQNIILSGYKFAKKLPEIISEAAHDR
ncbi:MAG: pyruvate formate lyase-activating protein [Candidatus Gastranaerophilales bacterium]|nr:pyruvate formate lyase-activating protein [Candidatus Gastranaerophilales bacterium]